MNAATLTSSPATEITSAWLARAVSSGGTGDLQVTRAPECSSPWRAERGSLVAVFGGALHNQRELSEQLGLATPPRDDATLVLLAYERWKQECPRYLRGIFAFVIWDGARRVLFGARDRVGVHPLFWARSGDQWLMSPSIDTLLADPRVPRTLNRSAMVDYIRHTWGDHPHETLFEAVHRVPAGHAFEVVQGQLRVWPYWSILKYDQEVDWLTDSEADGFHDMLDRAVNRCLRFGQSAIFLSGGFDSVSIAASAVGVARESNGPAPLALSLAFPHPECNEEPVQRGVAAGLGLDQIVVPFEEAVAPEGLIWSGMALGQRLSAPLTNSWGAAYYRLRLEAARRGCPVVMTGNGGDDWLTVDPMYVADLIRTRNFADLRAMLTNQMRSYSLPKLSLMRTLLWRYGARQLFAHRARRTLRRFTPSLLEAHRRHRLRSVTPRWLASDPVLQRESDRRVARVQAALDERPVPKGRYGFFHSEEPRGFIRPAIAMEFEEIFELGRQTRTFELAPYWDADLVEFLHRIPPKVLDRGGRAKGLVRETVARRFPTLGFDSQRKVSASAYFAATLHDEGIKSWRRLGGASALAALGVVDGRELADDVDRGFASRNILSMQRNFDVMNLEAWARTRVA